MIKGHIDVTVSLVIFEITFLNCFAHFLNHVWKQFFSVLTMLPKMIPQFLDHLDPLIEQILQKWIGNVKILITLVFRRKNWDFDLARVLCGSSFITSNHFGLKIKLWFIFARVIHLLLSKIKRASRKVPIRIHNLHIIYLSTYLWDFLRDLRNNYYCFTVFWYENQFFRHVILFDYKVPRLFSTYTMT